MAQLLVRKVEDAVIARLREEAAREHISVEEAHRRVLRRALLESGKKTKTLWEHLAAMPLAEEHDDLFEREKEVPRLAPDLED